MVRNKCLLPFGQTLHMSYIIFSTITSNELTFNHDRQAKTYHKVRDTYLDRKKKEEYLQKIFGLFIWPHILNPNLNLPLSHENIFTKSISCTILSISLKRKNKQQGKGT